MSSGNRCRRVQGGRKGEPKKISAVRDALCLFQRPFDSNEVIIFKKQNANGVEPTSFRLRALIKKCLYNKMLRNIRMIYFDLVDNWFVQYLFDFL